MASATDSTSNDDGAVGLNWSRRATLANRILALNLLTVLLVISQHPLSRCVPQPPEQGASAADPN